VADVFEFRAGGPGAPHARPERGFTPDNLCLVLPFFLIEGAPFDGDVEAARAMALANAHGTAHFLIEDAELDGDAAPTPERCRQSGAHHALFVRGYARLFGGRSPFWERFEEAIDEYYTSLRWERDVLRTEAGAGAVSGEDLAGTLAQLGGKMSPLKVTAYAVGFLSGETGVANAGASVVEAFHTAYQLADDLADLADDARKRRWSVPLWLTAARAGSARPPRGSDRESLLRAAQRCGALAEVTGAIERWYGEALSVATDVGSPSLRAFLRRCLVRATVANERLVRRQEIGVRVCSVSDDRDAADGAPEPAETGLAPTGSRFPSPSDIHSFSFDGEGFVYDVASGFFFEADSLTLEVIDCLRSPAGECAIDVLALNRGRRAVEEVVREVSVLNGEGTRASGRPEPVPGEPCRSSVTAIALDVTDGCNLDCDYCYLRPTLGPARTMTAEAARGAVDLLLTESTGEERASVVFFGGEPLLALDLIESTARYARERATKRGLRLTLHTTTNGTLLTPSAAKRLRAQGVRVLVSIDGSRGEHNAHRTFPDGTGSYNAVVQSMRALPPGMAIGARATVSAESGPLSDIVEHLTGLGFSVVHLAPVSGSEMTPSLSARLIVEFEKLARVERDRLLAGERPVVGNFVEPMVLLETGRARELPCGAGARYVCVAPDGRLFLCHRFAGDDRYAVGDVKQGLDRFAVGRLLGDLRSESPACDGCWARFLCGGPCHFDLRETPGDAVGPEAARCRLRKRVFELAMWLLDSIPSEKSSAIFREGR